MEGCNDAANPVRCSERVSECCRWPQKARVQREDESAVGKQQDECVYDAPRYRLDRLSFPTQFA